MLISPKPLNIAKKNLIPEISSTAVYCQSNPYKLFKRLNALQQKSTAESSHIPCISDLTFRHIRIFCSQRVFTVSSDVHYHFCLHHPYKFWSRFSSAIILKLATTELKLMRNFMWTAFFWSCCSALHTLFWCSVLRCETTRELFGSW